MTRKQLRQLPLVKHFFIARIVMNVEEGFNLKILLNTRVLVEYALQWTTNIRAFVQIYMYNTVYQERFFLLFSVI